MSHSKKTYSAIPLWPTQIAYQDALQNPALSFVDPNLRACVPVEFAAFGLPIPTAGQFANIYRMASPDGRHWAVKLFLRHLAGRTVHYRALSTHIGRMNPAPSWIVPFEYDEGGIVVGGHAYPLLAMPWLHGAKTLNEYINDVVADFGAIRRLRVAWRKLILELERQQFTHGDLQHGNVLVEDGIEGRPPILRLIDYDSSYVPSLAGRAGTEGGHPAYQHPRRPAGYFGTRMDRFPAVAIYTALLIVERAPDIWYRFENGDNVLFRREDFVETRAPGRALSELAGHTDPGVRRAVEAFQRVCEGQETLVPDIERYCLMAEM